MRRLSSTTPRCTNSNSMETGMQARSAWMKYKWPVKGREEPCVSDSRLSVISFHIEVEDTGEYWCWTKLDMISLKYASQVWVSAFELVVTQASIINWRALAYNLLIRGGRSELWATMLWIWKNLCGKHLGVLIRHNVPMNAAYKTDQLRPNTAL